jgi:hypothetical protein
MKSKTFGCRSLFMRDTFMNEKKRGIDVILKQGRGASFII